MFYIDGTHDGEGEINWENNKIDRYCYSYSRIAIKVVSYFFKYYGTLANDENSGIIFISTWG